MFDLLYTRVFPSLGRFFGILSGVASASFNTVVDYAFGSWGQLQVNIDCMNVFTGDSFVLTNYQLDLNIFDQIVSFFGKITGSAIKGIATFFGVGELPMFLALLILFGSFFFSIIFVRFVKNIVS